MPQPQVTIRNPPLLPLVPLSATLATTPQPSRVSIAVPNNFGQENYSKRHL